MMVHSRPLRPSEYWKQYVFPGMNLTSKQNPSLLAMLPRILDDTVLDSMYISLAVINDKIKQSATLCTPTDQAQQISYLMTFSTSLGH